MQKFADIAYTRPDYEAYKEKLSAFTEELKNASSYEEMKRIFFAKQEESRALEEAFTVCSIRADMNTEDPFYSKELPYLYQMQPTLIGPEQAWDQALLSSPFRADFSAEFGELLLAQIELAQKVQSPAIEKELVEESLLTDEYSRIAATCKVEFMGETCNFYGLLKHMESTDRDVRRAAFHAWARLYAGVADQLDDVYHRMVQLRVKMAEKMGYGSYTALAYANRQRLDYNEQDVAAFREQVREVVTPLVARLRAEQAKRLGIDKMHYYDEMLCFPEGNADPRGDKEFMVNAARQMYAELSPETKEFFDFMTEHELFDLVSRPGKRLGGYCTTLPMEKAPFIFSNFNGTAADTDVLTHEAGHAFEAYTAARCIPIDAQVWSTAEVDEIHSMAMETFTFPWMHLFFGEEAEKYKYIHLGDALAVMPYMCAVDEFQHEVYANPSMTGKDYRRVWHALEEKYMPWRDYDGEEFLSKGGFWMQKQHIFMYPFYYIDYALAQTCAFQFFTKMQADHAGAWAGYLKLCRSGGTRGYFDTLSYAGLDNPFRPGVVEASIRGVVDYLEKSGF